MGFFYELAARYEANIEVEAVVRRDVESLIELHTAKGVRAWLRRLIQSGSHARELSLKALIFSYRYAEDKRRDAEEFDYVYDVAKIPAFKAWVEAELKSSDDSNFANAREIAELLEPRSIREINAVWVLAVAVISAIMGAALKEIFGS